MRNDPYSKFNFLIQLGPDDVGGFTEVSPGVVQVEIGGTAQNCVRLLSISGWPGDVANSVRMPIREGYLTSVQVTCDAP